MKSITDMHEKFIMMNSEEKARAVSRLKRIEGQIRGIQKMVEEDRYCIDILSQTASIVSALRGVEDQIMQQHLNTCVSDAMKSDDTNLKNEKINEVMSVLSKFRKHG
ncbi:MAG TPA: metal-sensitive transcriptional regulator [Balneolales bacterium]|nr:metal-sensitive transcriptional regulator [Balneolales bacterium]